MNAPLFSSMHTHTVFCDGQDDVETMCLAAYEKKMYAVGFSAHAPVTKKTGIKTGWHMPDERLDEYVEQVLEAKRRWQGKLNVFLGFEVDYIKGLRTPADSDIKAVNPDFLIGSVHYVVPENGAEPFTVDGPDEEFSKGLNEGFGGDAEALMHCYYDTTAEMIKTGGFDILGHADIIKKNCIGKNLWPEETEARRQREIANLLAKNPDTRDAIAAEVNTGGINRGRIKEVYPSLSYLRIFREYDIPVIITSDAHCAKDIDGNYAEAIKTLFYADFKKHMIFLGKNNGKTVWQEEKIKI